MIDFKFNEKALKDLVEPAMRDIARGCSKEFATLAKKYQGSPLPLIKSEIRRVTGKYGMDFPEPELNKYAQLVSEGTKIEFRA